MMYSSTILELLRTGDDYLQSCGVEGSRAEADILLAYVLNTTRDKLYLDIDTAITNDNKTRYTDLLRRRGSREPLAYLLQGRSFMDFEFFVDERVLIPRPETELLVEKSLDIGKGRIQSEIRLLDLCTGSGILAVSISKYWPEASVTAVDISEDALDVARINAERLNVRVDFRQGDLFEPVIGEKFHIIVSNPPYISLDEYQECSPEVKREPAQALLAGEDGLDFYRRIAQGAHEYLRQEGKILMEIGCNQAYEVRTIFQEKGYKCTVYSDLAGLDRIVLAEEE